MIVFQIDGKDFTDTVQTYKAGYEVLLSEKSGRNARGTNVVDIVARKTKLSVTFMPMAAQRMKELLAAVQPYVMDITYWDAKADALKTINAYIGTPEITAIRMGTQSSRRRYDSFDLSFIEM